MLRKSRQSFFSVLAIAAVFVALGAEAKTHTEPPAAPAPVAPPAHDSMTTDDVPLSKGGKAGVSLAVLLPVLGFAIKYYKQHHTAGGVEDALKEANEDYLKMVSNFLYPPSLSATRQTTTDLFVFSILKSTCLSVCLSESRARH